MVRAELTAAIYRKAMRLSTRARQATETGRIVNHMSADVNTIQMFFYPFASQARTAWGGGGLLGGGAGVGTGCSESGSGGLCAVRIR